MMTMVISGSDGVTFPDSTNQFSGGAFSFKNRIINGAMVIDQRNAGAAVTLTSSVTYTVDRWLGVEDTDGVMTAQQDSSVPAGFTNSFKLTTTTADASLGATQYVVIGQRIEGLNVSDLGWGTANAKTITISFWVRSSLTGTFGGYLNNSGFNRYYVFSYSISSADTWEYKTVTIAGDTSGTWLTTNGTGLQLNFALGAGSTYSGTPGSWGSTTFVSATGAVSVIGTLNATWYITGVQLEVGSVATPFERRPYGLEFMLCQRYYQKSYEYSVAPGTAVSADAKSLINAAWSYAAVNSIANGCASFQVTMRASPTATVYDKAGNSGKFSTLSGVGAYTDNVTPNQIIASESNIIAQKYLQSCSGIAYAYTVSAEL
jgi:hypothetical protein